MCTSVVEIVRAEGAGRSEIGWFPVTEAVVSYDHPHHALLEEAITLDSAKALAGALARAIAAAEEMEAHRGRGAEG